MDFHRMLYFPLRGGASDRGCCGGQSPRSRRCCEPSVFERRRPACHQMVAQPQPDFACDAFMRELLQPLLAMAHSKAQENDRDEAMRRRSCPRWRRWTQEIELPQGFTAQHLMNVEREDGGITLLLEKTSRDRFGLRKMVAKRHVSLPENVLGSSVKVFSTKDGKLKITGHQKIMEKKDDAAVKKSTDVSKSGAVQSDEQADEKKPEYPSRGEKKDTPQSNQACPMDTSSVDTATVGEFEIVTMEGVESGRQSVGVSTDGSNPATTEDTAATEDCPRAATGDCPCDTGEGRPCVTENCGSAEEGCLCERDEDHDCTTEEESQRADGERCVMDSDGLRAAAEHPERDTPETEDRTPHVLSVDPQTFESSLDMSPFHPREVTVRLCGRELAVDAVRRDEEGDGDVSRIEMHRSVVLPEDADPDRMATRMSEDGVLVATAPRAERRDDVREISIEINN